MRTLPVFFGVLELLLRAGVTTVAEAAFQEPNLAAGAGTAAEPGPVPRRALHRGR